MPRPRLIERLDRGAASKLTLVSAPAGFGKTTLLAEWLAAGRVAERGSAAWLSLDQGDNDPASFWTYVIAALRTVAPGVGADALALLEVATTGSDPDGAHHPAQRPRRAGSDLVLVLDDYHVIDSREIQDGMAFLLDHLPPQLHLVIASRADPPLPLARLRARGELVEIRAADLRFTPDEAAAYLNEVMGLPLTARTWRRWRSAPKDGSPPSSWRRSRCRAATTSPASSPASPETTATSSTTWSRRWCSVSPNRSTTSCCRPPSWIG